MNKFLGTATFVAAMMAGGTAFALECKRSEASFDKPGGFPERALTMIVPYGPAGGSGQVAAAMAEAVTELPEALLPFQPELLGPGRLLFHYRTSQSPVNEILGAVAASGLTVADMSTEETDLEDIFLQLTRGAHGAGNGGS